MSISLDVYDESSSGTATQIRTLAFLTERITVLELIRERVYQEVREFNATPRDCFRGLVQPAEAEATLNGYKLRRPRQLDWEKQFASALDAFGSNAFILLVDDRQMEELDEEITIGPHTKVTFLKLVPLVGG